MELALTQRASDFDIQIHLRQQSKNDCVALASRPFVATRAKMVLVRDTLKPALIQSAK